MSESKKELPTLRPRNSSTVSLKEVTFTTEHNSQSQMQARPASAPLNIIKPQKSPDSEPSSPQIDPSSPPDSKKLDRRSFQLLLSQRYHPLFNQERLNPHLEVEPISSDSKHLYAQEKPSILKKVETVEYDTSHLEGVFQFDL